MSETPRIKFSEDWQETPPTMLPGEIGINSNATPPTFYAGNSDGQPRPLPGIIYASSVPPRPINGTLWINNANGRVAYWDDVSWVTLGSAGGQYDSGDFIGWFDPTIAGGGLTPPIDQNNSPNYVDGSYARGAKGGWYNFATGQPYDPATGANIPANTTWISVGETVIKDSATATGWRQMEDGAPPLGKLAIHNLWNTNTPNIGMLHTMGNSDGTGQPVFTVGPVASTAVNPAVSGGYMNHVWVQHIPADTDANQYQKQIVAWSDGKLSMSDMTQWGDTTDPDRPEIPGNPGHLDLFNDWSFLPKATIEAHFGGDSIIKNPTGEYNTITPGGNGAYGLIINSLTDSTAQSLLIKKPDGSTAFAVAKDGTTGIQGKLGVAEESFLYGDVHYVDQTNIGRNWRFYCTTLGTDPDDVLAMAIGQDPNAAPAQLTASKFSIRTSNAALTNFDFTFYTDGTLWLPVDPTDDVHAVRLGYLKSYTDAEFIHKTGDVTETADGDKTFTGKLVADGSIATNTYLGIKSNDGTGRQWIQAVADNGGIHTQGMTGGDYNSQLYIETRNATGGAIRRFTFKNNGRLQLPLDPSGTMDAVTKRYVDDNFLKDTEADGRYMNLTGAINETADGEKTFSGKLYAQGGIVNHAYHWWYNANDLNKQWASLASNAALNQLTFASSDHASRLQIRTKSATGGTSYNFTFRETGFLELSRDATSASHAIRKNYIDTKIIDDSQTYRMIRDKAAGSGAWVRSPVAGFLPNASGGNSSSLGTSGWRWKNIYGDAGNFNTLIVGGNPIDTTGFMDLTTNQTAAGEKTFTGKLRATGSLASQSYLSILNNNNSALNWAFGCGDATQNYLGLTGGDRLCSFYIDTKNATSGTSRRFFFTNDGYLTLPRTPPAGASTHTINGNWAKNYVFDDTQTYRGIRAKNGATNGWIRSGTPGFLPYTSGGNSSDLGTSGWRWRYIFGNGIDATNLTVGNAANFNGTYITGDGKNMLQFSDSWLRINPSAQFTSGTYMGGGLVRHDGILQFGANTYNYQRITNALRIRNFAQTSNYRDYKYEMANINGSWFGKFALPGNTSRAGDACAYGQRNAAQMNAEWDQVFTDLGIQEQAVKYDYVATNTASDMQAIADQMRIVDLERVVLELAKKVAELSP